MNGEREQILNETLDILFKVDVDGLRSLGLGWIADKVDEAYCEIQRTLTEYEFEDEDEEED